MRFPTTNYSVNPSAPYALFFEGWSMIMYYVMSMSIIICESKDIMSLLKDKKTEEIITFTLPLVPLFLRCCSAILISVLFLYIVLPPSSWNPPYYPAHFIRHISPLPDYPFLLFITYPWLIASFQHEQRLVFWKEKEGRLGGWVGGVDGPPSHQDGGPVTRSCENLSTPPDTWESKSHLRIHGTATHPSTLVY